MGSATIKRYGILNTIADEALGPNGRHPEVLADLQRYVTEAQPHIRTMAVSYPASEIYYFAPLNERVPAYQKPFTLLMDVVAEATAEGRRALAGKNELVLRGALEYQACDDKVCYNPVSLPLSWKVALRQNVQGAPRPPASPQ